MHRENGKIVRSYKVVINHLFNTGWRGDKNYWKREVGALVLAIREADDGSVFFICEHGRHRSASALLLLLVLAGALVSLHARVRNVFGDVCSRMSFRRRCVSVLIAKRGLYLHTSCAA